VVLFASVYTLELERSCSYSDLLLSAYGLVSVDNIDPHQQILGYQLQARPVLLLAAQ
jgi:hypothetical protein